VNIQHNPDSRKTAEAVENIVQNAARRSNTHNYVKPKFLSRWLIGRLAISHRLIDLILSGYGDKYRQNAAQTLAFSPVKTILFYGSHNSGSTPEDSSCAKNSGTCWVKNLSSRLPVPCRFSAINRVKRGEY
jgi:hypothetical protein